MTRYRSMGREAMAAVWLCLVLIIAMGRGASQQTAVPEGWPEQVDGRKPYACEFGFVYAREKSALDAMQKVLATVEEDVKRDGAGALPAGLVLVMDTKEKYPCEVARLAEALRKIDSNEAQDTLKVIEGAEEQSRDLGLDTSTVLSLAPMPIRVSLLHEIAGDFPADVDRQIGWCVIVPTDACIKASSKQTMDAAIKKEKPGLLQRATIAATMPLIERQMMSMMTKSRRAVLYKSLLDTRKDLSPEQKRAKVEAYKEKLGLKKKSSPPKPEPNATDP